MQRTETTLVLDLYGENQGGVLRSRYEVRPSTANSKRWVIDWEYTFRHNRETHKSGYGNYGSRERALEVLDLLADKASRIRTELEAHYSDAMAEIDAQWADVEAGEQHLRETEPK